ncbi:MAG: hypothetical protein ACK501_12260 [Planctomycetota bacterium]|jgi:hypothetical protein
MRTLPLLFVSSLLGLLPAQDSPATTQAPAPAPLTAEQLAAAKQRLSTALQKSAALVDTRFEAKWGADKKPKEGRNGNVAVFFGDLGGIAEGACQGSWHPDLLHVRYDGGANDELLVAGRRMLAKDDQTPWCVRKRRFANGADLGFVPDPQLLLQRLAAMDLAVAMREVGALDDRPVELLSASLDQDQLADLLWSEALPPTLAQSMGQIFRVAAGGNDQKRMGAPKPDATLDLVVHIDPATSLVQRLQFRCWTKDDMPGMGRVVVVNGGAVQAQEDEEEDEDEKANDANQPLRYENGLPVRPRKKINVVDFTARLSEHGKATAPALDDAQKKLLGR